MKSVILRASLVIFLAAYSFFFFLVVASASEENLLSSTVPEKYEIVFVKSGKTQSVPECSSKGLHRFHYTCEDDDDDKEGLRICTNVENKTVASTFVLSFLFSFNVLLFLIYSQMPCS